MPKALIGRDGRTIMQITEREFPVHPSLRWIDAPANVTTRWSYDGSRFTPPPPEPPPEPPQASPTERLAVKLRERGVLTQQDLDDIGIGRVNAPR